VSDEYKDPEYDIPRYEPSLGVIALCVVPAVASVFLPPPFLIPMIAATVALFATGLLMLRRQNRRDAS
jgi:hypothetical protein